MHSQAMGLTRNTFVIVAFGVTDDASTPGRMFIRLTVGIRSTSQIVAWIDAAAMITGKIVIAVLVRGALLLSLRTTTSRATGSVRIAC